MPQVFAQTSKKEMSGRFRQLTGLTVTEIKSKSYSHLARQLSLEAFVAYYLENGKEKFTKKYGREHIDTAYSDSSYTYFIRRAGTAPIDFIKVLSKDIDPEILGLDGGAIRKKFMDEIVPARDKLLVEKKSTDCSMGTGYDHFDYYYDRGKRQLLVKFKWKMTCDFVKVINKTYEARFDIETHKFVD